MASRSSGKALFVPVESAQSGTSPHSRATSRWVPSPPSTAIAATPASHISATARTVSRSVPVGVQSRVSSSGKRAPARKWPRLR